ncbi:MAG: ATP-binding protein [Myxococcaceae bacterium]|nr:ATP-binding protein [Myxococcaceae bacterium]
MTPAAVAHVDPALERWLQEQLASVPAERTQQWVLETLGPRSLLVVPLRGRERGLGQLVLFSGSPLRRSGQEARALAEELARRCALAVERAHLHREQQDAVRARDEFLTIVSHELKTPLTPLSLQLESMKRRLQAGQQVDVKAVDRVRNSLGRLVALIYDLLDSSRVASGRLPLQLAPTPLKELVQDVSASFASQSAEHPLVVEVPEEEIWVRGDGSRLEQVLANLLDNAIKYSPLGGPVRVVLQVQGEEAHMSVSDRGLGIPADQQKLLFERFFRARNVSARSYGGLGLGLYICRDIVERHGGRIWAESTPGAGSTLHVALPLLRAGDRLASTSPSTSPSTSTSTSTSTHEEPYEPPA